MAQRDLFQILTFTNEGSLMIATLSGQYRFVWKAVWRVWLRPEINPTSLVET